MTAKAKRADNGNKNRKHWLNFVSSNSALHVHETHIQSLVKDRQGTASSKESKSCLDPVSRQVEVVHLDVHRAQHAIQMAD
jgi:hypothetical protein